jgi:hypothetical protein
MGLERAGQGDVGRDNEKHQSRSMLTLSLPPPSIFQQLKPLKNDLIHFVSRKVFMFCFSQPQESPMYE